VFVRGVNPEAKQADSWSVAKRSRGPVCGLVGLLVLLVSATAGGEIYRWTDAEGRRHFTQRLDKVPPGQREAAKQSVSEEARPTARVDSRPAARERARAHARSQRGRIEIPFERMGSVMRVQVRLNDHVEAPFLIDTGASGVSLPARIADQLGIRVTSSTPTLTMHTANGVVARPVVTLDAVELGGARVEGLRATVNPTMEIGLLGGTFFNNFVYQVDAAAGVIRLEPNENVRGGMTAAEWSMRFQELRAPIAKLDAYLASQEVIRKGERARLERHREDLTRALEELDTEANRFSVPYRWRAK
jgi:clan AA aspartic protease (TIGR02281 family)